MRNLTSEVREQQGPLGGGVLEQPEDEEQQEEPQDEGQEEPDDGQEESSEGAETAGPLT